MTTSRRGAPPPADDSSPPGILRANAFGGLSYRPGEWPGDLKVIDQQIRNMPSVIAYLEKKGKEILAEVGDGFELVVSAKPTQRRPRVYIVPRTSEAIRRELTDSILLKSALGMVGR